jgi:sulfate permease, SulP family
VLSSVVFLIGIELVDIAGMLHVYAVRVDEFLVAAFTAATVVVLGVQQAVVFAVVVSIIDHLRRSYHPHDTVLVPRGTDFEQAAVSPGRRTLPGLVIYRFAAGLYYANAARFSQEILQIVSNGSDVRWFCVDAEAMTDVDYSGSKTLQEVHDILAERGIRLLFARTASDVRRSLDRYGITALVGGGAFFNHVSDVIDAFRSHGDDPNAPNNIN